MREMTPESDLVALVGRLHDARVLCVGDVMLDRFIYGEVTRISPEAPVPVCRVIEESAMLGGAGNVARNLVALGAAVDFVAVTGDDGPGGEVAELLGKLDRVEAYPVTQSGRPSTVKTRYFAGNQQLLRADRETAEPVSAATAEAVFDHAVAALDAAAILVLSDYGKGVLGPDLTGRLIAAAEDAGRKVIVDPKGDDYSRYRGASLVTPNRRELAQATRMATGGEDEIIAAARKLITGCGIEGVLVTRGADGMTLVSGAGSDHFSADAREVFDVSGAGDTVVAAMAAAMAVGAPATAAAGLANLAAGIVVGKLGTAVAHAADLVDAIRRDDLVGLGAGKVLTLEAACDRIDGWRRRGERIGFTNGCFDLIHPGHVALLAKSRAACDRLVVGLNSDASTRRLKGRGRPVQPAAARAAVLASLASVDLVVMFDDDTPLALIEAIKPDILAKGSDYTLDQVVGADLVRSWGGEVVLVELEPGHSTTATIARMGERAGSE
jgi:D-beta-D-heptose 7-phosphate kinase/D-beta-D-heptose 1-phosphate adenosyltransferase